MSCNEELVCEMAICAELFTQVYNNMIVCYWHNTVRSQYNNNIIIIAILLPVRGDGNTRHKMYTYGGWIDNNNNNNILYKTKRIKGHFFPMLLERKFFPLVSNFPLCLGLPEAAVVELRLRESEA